ncbi:MAG: type II CAAX endopeptidase family protein [Pseudomonadota bacterium]
MDYSRFHHLTDPARDKAELWRTAVGLLCATALYTGGSFLFFGIIMSALGASAMEEVIGGSTPRGTLLLLAHFGLMAGSVVLTVIFLHGRGALTLLGDRARLWRDFLSMSQLALIVALAMGVIVAVFYDIGTNTPFGTWLLLLPLALPLVLLQTGAEELVFRGYLQQQLGARVAARTVWLLVPAVLFALVHVDAETMGANLWLYLFVIFVFALVTGDITARTGSLGAAWGLHFVNNVNALLVFSFVGSLSGLGLTNVGLAVSDPGVRPLLFADAAGLALIYILWRRRHG